MSQNEKYICIKCEKEKTYDEMDYQYDTYWIPESKQKLEYCSDCLSDMGEAAYERMVDNYYGSSSPQTQAEKFELAQKEKYK